MWMCSMFNLIGDFSSVISIVQFCLYLFGFDLILYAPVNIFSVIAGRFFLGRTSTKQ